MAVAYLILAAPLEPPLRATTTVSELALDLTEYDGADSAMVLKGAVAAAMVIVADCVPSVAPLTFDRTTLKVLPPEPFARMGIANVLADTSPFAQLRVPDEALKSVPAIAVPLAVEYWAVTAPLLPDRFTVMINEPEAGVAA